MVIDVQEGQVGEFLLQDEEEGVKHVKEFGDVEDPGKIQSPHCFWIIGVVDGFTGPAVVSTDVESGTVGELFSQSETLHMIYYFQPSVNPHRLNRVWNRLYAMITDLISYGSRFFINLNFTVLTFDF